MSAKLLIAQLMLPGLTMLSKSSLQLFWLALHATAAWPATWLVSMFLLTSPIGLVGGMVSIP